MSISFETLALAKRYTQEAIADAIGGVTKIDFRFVETLPLVGEAGVIYCVPVNSEDASDLYDEYYYANGRFERLRGVRIDLTPYATKNWVTGEGYYKKPADGIPGTDLDDATKAALAKAKTALQEHQSLAAYRTAAQQDTKDQQTLSVYRTAAAQDMIDSNLINNINEIKSSIFIIDGTNTSSVFRDWWDLSMVDGETKYSHLERFFSMLADKWKEKKYTLKYYQHTVSSSPVMTPIDDLADKQPAQLCTDATTPVKDWADEDPMTWYVRANALSLADGTMNILAIEGLDDEFDLSGEIAPVWTFCMALWKKEWDEGDYSYKSWATQQYPGYEPYAGDVDPTTNQKRIMTWRPTFPGSLTNDGTKLTSGAGKKPYLFAAATAGLTKARAMDAYEGLWNDADAIWVLDMWQLRHFNLENSSICEGCQSYNFTYTSPVAETGVTRVCLPAASANKLQIGSNISIGTSDQVNNVRTILSKEEVTVSDTAYIAVNVDGEAFDTTTETKICTMPWNSGNTENLPGHKDGACHSLTAGQNPMRVQGVEMMSGANDVGLDPLYNVTNFASSKGDYAVYECRNSENLSGSITANYEDTGIVYEQMPQGVNYPKKFVRTSKAVLFPEVLGGSTSTYFKSGFGGAHSAGVRCPWRSGTLNLGANAGLACENGSSAPSTSYWNGRPRLSGSGKKRGVWTA